jgi:hypothetical protein
LDEKMHVDLDRKFRDLTDEERADSSRINLYMGFSHFGTNWEALLKSKRVILLAEAGSGKTREMQAQKERIVQGGKHAFFLPIEQLGSESVRDILGREPNELDRFESWVAGSEIGVFFLDAVDELKLTYGRFEKALGNLNKDISKYKHRIQLVVSCRPADWRPIEDLNTFNEFFPVVSPAPKDMSEDEVFLAPFKKKDDPNFEEDAENDNSSKKKEKELRVVVLLPLNEEQIKKFCKARDVEDVSALMKEISKQDAWSFARRPLDLQELILFWQQYNKIGTSAEQHKLHIEFSLKEDSKRRDHGLLSPEKSLEGVERLALALTLTKKRTILAPEHAIGKKISKNSIDANKILPDWKIEEISALLRRPIFDPATYGNIRFHHRSVQEYLAANYLIKMLADGLPREELYRLLFAEKYGEKVLIPSMRPIAAWIALKDKGVMSEILSREPENLVVYGDPSLLDLETKSQIFQNYLKEYGQGGWRGLDMPLTQIRRLATPDLEDTIRKCWRTKYENEEISEFILKSIWLGDIDRCSDLAFQALIDVRQSDYARIVAARALSSFKRNDLLKKAVKNLFSARKKWPNKVIHSIVGDLFPSAMSGKQLIELIESVPEPRSSTGGYSWELFQLADEIDIGTSEVSQFRDALAHLIAKNIADGSNVFRLASKYSYLCPALVRICLRQINEGMSGIELYKSAVVAVRFNTEETIARDEDPQLERLLHVTPIKYREELFWFEDSVVSPKRKPQDFMGHNFLYDSFLRQPTEEDIAWLLKTISKSQNTYRKRASFEILTWLWQISSRKTELLARLETAAKNSKEFQDKINVLKTPPKQDDTLKKFEKQDRDWKRQRKEKDDRILKSWKDWKVKIRKNINAAFSPKKVTGTIGAIDRWLSFQREGASIARKNWRDVRRALGDEIADRFEEYSQSLWRKTKVRLYSKREITDHSSVYWDSVYALTGLEIERAKVPNWPNYLTDIEVDLVTEWATLEYNLDWIDEIIKHRPQVVHRVLKRELEIELHRDPAPDHHRILQHILYGTTEVKKLMAKDLRGYILKFVVGREASFDKWISKSLSQIIAVLLEINEFDDRLEKHAQKVVLNNPLSDHSIVWLKALAATNIKRGLDVLKKALAQIPVSKREQTAIMWMANMFGHRGGHDKIFIDLQKATLAQLYDLSALSYKWVKREKDTEHDGIFTPQTRDDAQSARNRIFGAIADSVGEEAYKTLKRMSKQKHLDHMSDRIVMLARERAAKDSELNEIEVDEFTAFEMLHCRQPQNDNELLQVVIDRLRDIDHDFHNHDFSDIETVRKFKIEDALQKNIAAKLENMQRTHYSVTREGEVYDKKRPDIRLSARGYGGRATIEIKIGDSWSLAELKSAVRKQLAGQYLRHKNCSLGVLLVTYAGRKKFKMPRSGKSVGYKEVIEVLQAEANAIQGSSNLKVRVVGFDLRKKPKDRNR